VFWKLVPPVMILTTWLTFPNYANGFHTPKMMVWMMGSFLIGTASLWNPPTRRCYSNKWLWFGIVYVCVLFSWKVIWPQIAISHIREQPVPQPWNFYAIYPTLIFIGSMLAIDSMVRHTENNSRWELVAKWVCWVGGSVALYGWLQYFGLDQWQPLNGRNLVANTYPITAPITVFGNPMVTATFLSICSPLCLIFNQFRYKLLFCFIAGLVLAMSTHPAVGVIGVFVGVLVFCYLRKHWVTMFSICAASILFGLALLHYMSFAEFIRDGGRIAACKELIAAWRGLAPWTGLGIGSLVQAGVGGFKFVPLHNDYIQLLGEAGLIGFVLGVCAVGSLIVRAARAPKTRLLSGWLASLSAYAVSMLVSFPMHFGPGIMLGCLIWAAIASLSGVSENA